MIDSYWVSQDGTYKYYEVLMVDPSNDNVLRDYRVRDILARRRRERTEVAGRMISKNLSPPRSGSGYRGSGWRGSPGYQRGGSHRDRDSYDRSSYSRHHTSSSRSRDSYSGAYASQHW